MILHQLKNFRYLLIVLSLFILKSLINVQELLVHFFLVFLEVVQEIVCDVLVRFFERKVGV
jgi:hypothetical protein